MGFSFEKLSVYKRAVDFAGKIYKITKDFPANEIYGITSQIRRASISVPSNIAEGSGRYHKKDFVQFLRIARSSIYECIPLLEIALKENYIKKSIFDELTTECNELSMMVNGLIRSLKADKS
ncbi:MAG: four helix bundle protein [Nitrospirae bacterium]|nr:four helix bundle protein [Nitrospirota bacterium]MBI4839376.1 four helix bundle protein [Nitrospirota bacterium]MBI5196754.1 four helix bundle protein [Nitrospirota bacterium]